MSPRTSGIPLPRPTALSKPHWDGCRQGVLRVQRCRVCAQYVFIPQPVCTNCLETTLDWVESSGRGTLYSFTVVYRPPQPSFDVPYVPIIVEMQEGWYMLSNLRGVAPEQIRIGTPLEVFFERMSDEITLPYFRPATSFDPFVRSRSKRVR